MALDFTAADSDRVDWAITTPPAGSFSIGFRVKWTGSVPANKVVGGLFDKDAATHQYRLITSLNLITSQTFDGIGGTDTSGTVSITADTWYWICGVFTVDGSNNVSSHKVIVNGTASTAATGGKAYANVDRMTAGIAGDSTPAGEIDAIIQDATLWDGVLLATAECAAIGNGASPLLIRPESILLHAPMGAGIQDVVGQHVATESGTSQAEGDLSTIAEPWMVNYTPAAGGGTTVPIFRQHHENRIRA